MTYSDLTTQLMSGAIEPHHARELALDLFQADSDACRHKWLLYHPELDIVADELLEPARRVVSVQRHEPCLKAGFFAALFSPHMHKLVTRIECTRPAHGSAKCMWGRECLRTVTDIQGDQYANCMSVHAAQWLDVPQGFDAASLLWMETGAVLVNGEYVLSGGEERPYRCSMCLKTMLGKGIVDVCRVGEKDGKPRLHFAPITSSLGALVVCNVADMILENATCTTCR